MVANSIILHSPSCTLDVAMSTRTMSVNQGVTSRGARFTDGKARPDSWGALNYSSAVNYLIQLDLIRKARQYD